VESYSFPFRYPVLETLIVNPWPIEPGIDLVSSRMCPEFSIFFSLGIPVRTRMIILRSRFYDVVLGYKVFLVEGSSIEKRPSTVMLLHVCCQECFVLGDASDFLV
jgi:hypothetical protein